jgi:putative ABC transport system ATP-binding protein
MEGTMNNVHSIDLKGVTKTFESGVGSTTVLRQIDLHIDKGEFVTILGKSGSGKSTLLNMMVAIDSPTSGEVFVFGTPVHSLTESRAAVWRGKSVGIVFQFFQLLPSLNVVENVMLPMDFCGTYPTRERRPRAMELLERVGLQMHAEKLPSMLSGGEQQRVAVCRALANDPPLIIADEPTGNLDSRTAGAIMELFGELTKNGKTLVMVTHEKNGIEGVDRQILLDDGAIVSGDAAVAGN